MMEFVSKGLEGEYNFWCNEISKANTEGFANFLLTPHDVIDAHFLICDYFIEKGEGIGAIGPRDINLFLSAIARQHTGYSGVSKWKNDFERCATVFYGIIKNHPFHDANKRTAFLSSMYYLWKLNRIPCVRHKVFETLTIRVAENQLLKYPKFKGYEKYDDPEIIFIGDFFKKRTRRQNKRIYLLTFNQFNKKLKQFGCRLDNPSGNYIDVVTWEEKRRLFGIGKPKVEERRIMKIGFPGWTREVDKKTIRDVLRATGLTSENGVDSDAFFRGAEPLPSLIPIYHSVLMRLKNK